MSHNYDVIGSGNYENRILRPKFSGSEYFAIIFLEFAYSDGILKGHPMSVLRLLPNVVILVNRLCWFQKCD